jgi:hypothetical protein
MTSHSWLFTNDVLAHPTTSMTIQKRADEIAAEMFAKAEKRRLALEELKSEFHSPADRIRAWEKLYGLRLPFDSSHAILATIAQSTGLTLAQVRDEQRSRNTQAASRPVSRDVYG